MTVPATHQGGVQVLFPTLGQTSLDVGGTELALPNLPNANALRRAVIRNTGTGNVLIWAETGPFRDADAMIMGGNEIWVVDTDFTLIKLKSVSGTNNVRIWYLGL